MLRMLRIRRKMHWWAREADGSSTLMASAGATRLRTRLARMAACIGRIAHSRSANLSSSAITELGRL